MKKATSFIISEEVVKDLKVYCAKHHLSMSRFIEELIVDELNFLEAKKNENKSFED